MYRGGHRDMYRGGGVTGACMGSQGNVWGGQDRVKGPGLAPWQLAGALSREKYFNLTNLK